VFPEIPGIVEASMTINPEADGRISFRVVIGADSGQSSGYDLIELIVSPEDINRALAGAKISALAGTQIADEPATFPCHIGLYRDARVRCGQEQPATRTAGAAAQPDSARPQPR
jgi:hypothetical protein